jgi:hypothetical protein
MFNFFTIACPNIERPAAYSLSKIAFEKALLSGN